DFLIELVDDLGWCVLRRANPLPTACFITRQEVRYCRNVRQQGQAGPAHHCQRRSLPALMCSIDSGTGLKITCTWPPSRSVIAGAPPRDGTCTKSTPAIILNSSPERCCGVPLPADAILILPGLALA